MGLVWPRLVVEENSLQFQLTTLRKLLGHPTIATMPGRGYRFTRPVVDEGPPASAGDGAEPPTRVQALLAGQERPAGAA